MTRFTTLMHHSHQGIPHYDPDSPEDLTDAEAEQLLVLLHKYATSPNSSSGLPDPDAEVFNDMVEDLVMSMSPTTDLADRLRHDLTA